MTLTCHLSIPFRHTQKAEELIKAQKAKKHQQHQTVHITQSAATDNEIMDVVDDGQVNQDWQYDPNEPRYCLCNQVSYGEMVGCDNNDVSNSQTSIKLLTILYSHVNSGVEPTALSARIRLSIIL